VQADIATWVAGSALEPSGSDLAFALLSVGVLALATFLVERWALRKNENAEDELFGFLFLKILLPAPLTAWVIVVTAALVP
jgi:hypothetical protein